MLRRLWSPLVLRLLGALVLAGSASRLSHPPPAAAALRLLAAVALALSSLPLSVLAPPGAALAPQPAQAAGNTLVRAWTGPVDHTSVVLDAAGNPVVSFYESRNGDLKVLHCGDPACSAGNTITTPDSVGTVGQYNSLALDAAGNPVVAYYDGNGKVKVLHCGDPTCSAGNTIVYPDPAPLVGAPISLALDQNGNPVVAYGYTLLKVLHCGDPTCIAGNTIATADLAVGGAAWASLALDTNGNPVVSYHDGSPNSFWNRLKVLHCGNPTCTAGNNIRAFGQNSGGTYSSLALDTAGNPVVSYVQNGDLRVLHCGDPTCSAVNSSAAPDTVGEVGWYSSLKLDAAGRPVVSYYEATTGSQALKVLRCGDPACSAGNTIFSLSVSPFQARGVSLALDRVGTGNPVVSYYNEAAGGLQVLHCGTPTCLASGLGTIGGTVYGGSATPGNELPGAAVEICSAVGCYTTTTDGAGRYSAPDLPAGQYTVRVFPPAGSNFHTSTAGPLDLQAGGALTPDFALAGVTPPPPGTGITPGRAGGGGAPVVYWGDPLTLFTTDCAGGTGSYEMLQYDALEGNRVIRSGAMTEGPAGNYSAILAPLAPLHGDAFVVITIVCPGIGTITTFFDIYIDPSGTVQTTTGAPIAGATVTLSRSATASGPFAPVPDGDAIMSPINRRNPDATDAGGHFGWDVLAGFYRVRAEKAGCFAPGAPSQGYVETAVLTIPPPVTDLLLVLECPVVDSTPPDITPAVTGTVGSNGWHISDVAVSWTVTDPESPVTSSTGCGPSSVTADTAGITFTCTATSAGGTASQSVTIKRDATAPAVTAAASPAANANGWNNTDVTVAASGTDSGAGMDACTTATLSAEGANQSATVSCTDQAGNSASATASGVNIDKTAPSLAPSQNPAANANGWNNSDVTVSANGADSGAGIDACTTAALTAEGANQSATVSCTDKAGNSASATASGVNIDKTSPVTTATPSPAANANGWNNSAVAVTLAATDNLSGVALTEFNLDGGGWTAYSSPVAIAAQGIHTLLFRSTDKAGNLEGAGSLTVRIDLTPAEFAVQLDPAAKDITVTARDSGGSGVGSGPLSPASSTPVKWGDGDEDDEDDDHDKTNAAQRTYSVSDVAGNTSTLVLKIKKSGKEIKVRLISVQYNGAPAVSLVKNSEKFEWSVEKNNALKELKQKMAIGPEGAEQEVSAKFDAKKNQTVIEAGAGKVTQTGLALLRMVTNQGQLAVEY